MKNITIGSLFKPLSNLLARFHMTIFIVFITAGLSVAVLFLNSILTDTSSGDGYTSPIGAGSIDQATLERIKELHTSDEAVPASTLPEGRINPFGE
jgi:hypothetical protein